MNYATKIERYIHAVDGVVNEATKKRAEELEGTWIMINETMFALEEKDQTTIIDVRDEIDGCACERFSVPENLMCEHVVAFGDLKSPPNLTIESSQCRGLQQVLMSEGWTSENRYLYPPISGTKLDPVNEDKPLDIGVGDAETEESSIEEEPKMISRKCGYPGCDYIESGTDRPAVVKKIADHRKTCTKNPAKKKAKVPEKPKPTDAKPAPVEKEKMKEKPKQKNTAVSTDVVMPSDAEFRDAKTERILQSQGGFYKVAGGKEVPDAMAVQAYAVGTAGISTEVMKIEQDDKHVLAIVRCHRGGLYTDASVYIDFEVQRKRELLKIANKNPKAVRGWDERGPMFDPDFKVVTESKNVPLMVHIFNRMTDFQYFAPRTAESQAIRRGQAKMLGSEWRDAEEINTEAEEVSSVNRK